MGMDLPLLNLATFRVEPEPETVQGGRPGRDAGWQDYSLRDAGDDPGNKVDRSGEEATTISLAAADSTLWGLTELEQLQLKTAVEREEQAVDTGRKYNRPAAHSTCPPGGERDPGIPAGPFVSSTVCSNSSLRTP